MANPLPYSCTLLVLTLPGIYLLGRRLTEGLEAEPAVRQAVVPFAALGPWILAVGAVGRAASSFVVGLSVGSLATGIAGGLWTLRSSRRASPQAPEPQVAATRRVMWMGLLVTLPVAALTLGSDFFDDYNLIGHRSLVAQFQNDSFPPHHQVYPEYLLRYHYGFNLVAAGLTALFRLPLGFAIDVVVIAGFFASFVLAWRLGERLSPGGSGLWTALGGLLTGGAFYWFVWYSDWSQHAAVGVVVGGNRINFPVLMYFFQKPFALGFPLALALMLQASATSPPGDWRRRGLLTSSLLAPLSLVQVVLFVTVGAALAAHAFLEERRLRALVPFVASLLLAVPLGGVLFTALPIEPEPLLRPWLWPAHDDPLMVLVWYFLTTGVLIPLGLLGALGMARLRSFFVLLIAGSFTVPLFFHNPTSWDIVKFSTVGQLAAGLASGTVLARWARIGSRYRSAAVAAVTAMLVLSPVGYFVAWAREVVWPTPALGEILAGQRQPMGTADWTRIIDWLRRTGPTDGVIYCSDPLFQRELLFAGLYTAGPAGPINPQFGVAPARIARRRSLLERLPTRPEPWLAEGVVWMVTTENAPMADALRAWVAEGRAEHAAVAGRWNVYRLLPAEPDASN